MVKSTLAEEEELYLFLEADELTTGDVLKCVRAGESPDFVCVRSDGEEVGVELTRVTRSPDEEFHDRVILRKAHQEAQEALDVAFELLEDKEGKRARLYGEFTNSTILVLQLFDCPLAALMRILDEQLQSDFSENGFLEIWLADYTDVEAYGDVELFGLKPLEWWGYHERPRPGRKPFG